MIKCKKHPKYQAKRKPTSKCEECNFIWDNRKEQKQWDEVGKLLDELFLY